MCKLEGGALFNPNLQCRGALPVEDIGGPRMEARSQGEEW